MDHSEEQSSRLRQLQARGLPDEVHDILLRMLTSGELAPLSPLSIDQISRSLHVSPTPVREALARLEYTGLVERVARRGYRVAPPMSAENMRELADARIVLELGAVERAMKRREELLPELQDAFANHAEAALEIAASDGKFTSDQVQHYFEQDWSFHQAILNHCGNRYIERSVNALSFSVHRMRQTMGVGHTDAPIAVQEHRAIMDAVRDGNTDAAMAAMRAHLINVASRSASEGIDQE